MCYYKTLANTQHGYVIRCSKCDHIHVAFGTTELTFSYRQFFNFYSTVQSYAMVGCLTAFPEYKNVRIPTGIRSVTLVYSATEIEQLLSLLHTANKEISIAKLFPVFEN